MFSIVRQSCLTTIYKHHVTPSAAGSSLTTLPYPIDQKIVITMPRNLSKYCPTLCNVPMYQRTFIMAAIELETWANMPADCSVHQGQIRDFLGRHLVNWGCLGGFEAQDAGCAIAEATDEAFRRLSLYSHVGWVDMIQKFVASINTHAMFATRSDQGGAIQDWCCAAVQRSTKHMLPSMQASQRASDLKNMRYGAAGGTGDGQKFPSRAAPPAEAVDEPAIPPHSIKAPQRYMAQQHAHLSADRSTSRLGGYSLETSQNGQVTVCIDDSESDNEVSVIHNRRKQSQLSRSTESDLEDIAHTQRRRQRLRPNKGSGGGNRWQRQSCEGRALEVGSLMQYRSTVDAALSVPRMTLAPTADMNMNPGTGEGFWRGRESGAYASQIDDVIVCISNSESNHDVHFNHDRWKRAQFLQSLGSDSEEISDTQKSWKPTAANKDPMANNRLRRLHDDMRSGKTAGLIKRRRRMEDPPYTLGNTSTPAEDSQPREEIFRGGESGAYASSALSIGYLKPIVYSKPIAMMYIALQRFARSCDIKLPPMDELVRPRVQHNSHGGVKGPTTAPATTEPASFLSRQMRRYPPILPYPGPFSGALAAKNIQSDVQADQKDEPGYLPNSNFSMPHPRPIPTAPAAMRVQAGVQTDRHREPRCTAKSKLSTSSYRLFACARAPKSVQSDDQTLHSDEPEYMPTCKVSTQGGYKGYKSKRYRDGNIVAAGASEIGHGNRGRAMLEKMGWSKGKALGVTGREGILVPIEQTFKSGTAGLGGS